MNRDHNRNAYLRHKYNLTPEQYDYMFELQSGLCAICGNASNKRLAIDHCHAKGHVRKLLCFKCNTGLGSFGDDPQLMLKAVAYLLATPAPIPEIPSEHRPVPIPPAYTTRRKRDGTTQPKAGRPFVPDSERKSTATVRLTMEQHRKMRAIGGDKLRAWLDSLEI